MNELPNEAQRRRAIAWATAFTTNTSLEPQPYERLLLERYARGELTLDQVLQQLDTQVYYLLYRSQAVLPFSPEQLTNLLEEARCYNNAHGITGLLCYGAGHFVQVLEGESAAVQTVYAKIRRDTRHQEIITLYEAAGPERHFADWSMAFVSVEDEEFEWLLTCLEAPRHGLGLPQIPITEPHLLTLLGAFSHAA